LEKSDVYGMIWCDVGDSGSITSQGFTNWKVYW
jgi:hypothetical protein